MTPTLQSIIEFIVNISIKINSIMLHCVCVIIISLAFVVLMCLDNVFMYKSTSRALKLSEKQRAYIMSIKSSITMFVFGCLAVSGYFVDKEMYTSNVQPMAFLAVLSFISYLICDCIVGSMEYPKYMRSLSGYTHHIAYIFINIISLVTGRYPLYMLYMIEELPTVILSIGSYSKKHRHDDLFGWTFFATRIVYHIVLTYYLRHDRLLLFFSMLILPLHLYWFYGWVKKYKNKTKVKQS